MGSLTAADPRIRWSPAKTAWFLATGAPGLALAPWALSWETAAVGGALGVGTFLLGHTVALHRCVLHGALVLPAVVRNALLVLFVLTGLGGPLTWIRVHDQRDHWQNRADAPPWFRFDHGLLRDLWWNLHTVYVEDRPLRPNVDDRWLGWLERTWLGWNLALFGALWVLGGWPHLVIGGFLRVWLSLVLHWWVGYEAHARGAVRYPIAGAATAGRNRPLLGIVSFGEGFHNNHHAFPHSARIGHRWWEIDLGWWVIRALEAVGVATAVKRPEHGPSRSEAARDAAVGWR